MIQGSLARRYARALLLLAREDDKVEKLGEQLQGVAKTLEDNPELFDSLRNPAYPFEQRKAVVVDFVDRMGLEPVMRNFVLLVMDRKRFEHLPSMALAYRELADQMAGRVRAVVTTATELGANQQKVIKNTLSDKIGKTVLVTHKKDPDIIGGVVAQVGNMKFDYSLLNQLRRVRSELAG